MRKMLSVLLCLLLGFACLNVLADDVKELRFPADLVEIGQEAFMDDVSIERVVLHEGIRRIGVRAFAFSSATEVYLPVSLTELADDAFEGCESVHLYVYKYSYAHEWCLQHTIPYTVLDEVEVPTDTPADKVLDYGSAGYAVIAEDVIRIAQPAVALGGSRYTLTTDEQLTIGDVVYISVDGTEDMYKIAAISENEDGTVTITEDPAISLAEMYDAIYLDTCLTSAGADTHLSMDETFTVIDGTFSVEAGPAELSANMTMKIRLKCIYDKKLLGKDYVEMEVYTESSGDCSVFVGSNIDTWKAGNPPEVPIYSGIVIIPGVNLPCQLKVSIPCHMVLAGGSTVGFGYSNKSGFRYVSGEDYEKIEARDAHATAELTGNVELAAGPEISLGLSLFKDTIVAKIGGQVGLKATGELVTPGLGGSNAQPEDSIHACNSCVDIDLSVFGQMRGTCKIDLHEKVSITLADIVICEGEIGLDAAHCSILNDPESIYEGKVHFGLGECQNKKYMATIRTIDVEYAEVAGLPLTITGQKTSPLSATSPAYTYLYPGGYNASATFEGGVVDEYFFVQDRAVTVTIKEEPVVIKGVVTSSDGGKALENASVILTLPDGSTRSTLTDERGAYEFGELPAGAYSMEFSASGHQNENLNDLQYTAGTTNAVNVELKVSQKLPIITTGATRSAAVQAKTSDGTVPDNVPEVWLTPTSAQWGLNGASITHEDCAEPLVFTTRITPREAELWGVDMGNGAYTFVLLMAGSGTGGGYDILIFRENNGVLEVLRWLTYDEFTDDIRLDAAFTSNTDFSGVIHPSGRTVSGHVNKEYSFDDRTGEDIYDGTIGSIKYVENDDGFYDLVFMTSDWCLGSWDYIGSVHTRYVMEDGELVMDDQWYEIYNGTVTYGD